MARKVTSLSLDYHLRKLKATATCYQKMITSRGAGWIGVRLMSVDGSQGDESPCVILGPVTPGGIEFGLGFLRSLVALLYLEQEMA